MGYKVVLDNILPVVGTLLEDVNAEVCLCLFLRKSIVNLLQQHYFVTIRFEPRQLGLW